MNPMFLGKPVIGGLTPLRRRPPLRGAVCFAAVWALVLSGAGTSATGAAEQLPSAEEALTRSIAYHDPDGAWANGIHRLTLASSRPDGSTRETTIVVDNTTGGFTMHRPMADGSMLEASVVGDTCNALVDGLTPTPEQIDEANLDCTAMQRTRNYHVYLYGLPMKLRDPGTILHDEVEQTTFQERRVYAVKVSYEPEVGGDTWYFYLDRETYALVGYRFYHDESANDGEYITLEDEAVGGSVRLPKVRAWYMNADDRYLGTDTITAIVPLPNSR